MKRRPLAEGLVLVSTIQRGAAGQGAWGRRPSRIARMLALAHHLQRAIDSGAISDCATIARALGLSRARISQMMGLLLLAPEIQEAILATEAVDGLEPSRERDLYPICRISDWRTQRGMALPWRTQESDRVASAAGS